MYNQFIEDLDILINDIDEIIEKVELEKDMNYNSIFNPDKISDKRWFKIRQFKILPSP